MKIPKYWARAETQALAAWGWSDESRTHAEAHARQRLAALEERIRRGEKPHAYAYGRNPLREEIIDEIHDADDHLAAVMTRNSYGCLVVNAAHALFVDVDLPEPTLVERVAALFGRGRGRAAERLAALRDVLRSQPAASFRIYRTAGGFRVLATNPPFSPDSPQTEALLRAAGADPAFIQLCRLQRSFRARLTPKPWRLRLQLPPGTYPREDPDDQAAFCGVAGQLYEGLGNKGHMSLRRECWRRGRALVGRSNLAAARRLHEGEIRSPSGKVAQRKHWHRDKRPITGVDTDDVLRHRRLAAIDLRIGSRPAQHLIAIAAYPREIEVDGFDIAGGERHQSHIIGAGQSQGRFRSRLRDRRRRAQYRSSRCSTNKRPPADRHAASSNPINPL